MTEIDILNNIKNKVLEDKFTKLNTTSARKLLLNPKTKKVILNNTYFGTKLHKCNKLNIFKFFNPLNNNNKNKNYIKLHVPTNLMKFVCLVIFTNVKSINSLIETYILSNPNEVNVQNNDGDTVLHLLLKNLNTSNLEILHLITIIIKYSRRDIQNNRGLTVLHIYCRSNYQSDVILDALFNKIDNNKFVNIKDSHGYTALKYCSGHDNKIPLMYYLIKHNAIYSFDDLQITNVVVLKNLLNKDVINIHDIDENGENLIFYAVRQVNISLLKYLISMNVNTKQVDDRGINIEILLDSIKTTISDEDYEKIINLLQLKTAIETFELKKTKHLN